MSIPSIEIRLDPARLDAEPGHVKVGDVAESDAAGNRPFRRAFLEQHRRHGARRQPEPAPHESHRDFEQMREPGQSEAAVAKYGDALPVRFVTALQHIADAEAPFPGPENFHCSRALVPVNPPVLFHTFRQAVGLKFGVVQTGPIDPFHVDATSCAGSFWF